jgi:hypothetical protein
MNHKHTTISRRLALMIAIAALALTALAAGQHRFTPLPSANGNWHTPVVQSANGQLHAYAPATQPANTTWHTPVAQPNSRGG